MGQALSQVLSQQRYTKLNISAPAELRDILVRKAGN